MFRAVRKLFSRVLDEAALWARVARDAAGSLAGPEEGDEGTVPEPERDWSVTWIVARDHRAVVGHRSDVVPDGLVPDGLVRGHVLATGLTKDECERFVESVGHRPNLPD